MRLLIAFVAFFIAAQAFACSQEEAEAVVTKYISQDFNRVETVRTLKLGTITADDALDGDDLTIVHAVVEVERYGRKVNEQAIVFKLNEFCKMIGTHGAVLHKVPVTTNH